MPAEDAAAEGAGDVDAVARLRAGSGDRRDAAAFAENRDGDDELAVPRAGVAADESAVEWIGGVAQTEVQLLRIIDARVPWLAARRSRRPPREGRPWRRSRTRLRFITLRPIARGMDGRIEMHAVEHLIDADQQQIARRSTSVRPDRRPGGTGTKSPGCAGTDPVDEVKLAGHGGIVVEEKVDCRLRLRRMTAVVLPILTLESDCC